MRIRRWMPWATAALVAVALAVAAVGSAKPESKEKAGGANIRVAMVSDIGGLNDRSFNFLSNQGRLRADRQFRNVTTRVFVTKTAADRLPNLTSAAQQGYDLVIGVGFLLFGEMDKVAQAFPNTRFAGVDIPWEVAGKRKNFRGLLFKEQEAGYLAGYLAGLTIKRNPKFGQQTVSAVGANPVPAIVRFMAGYRAGARKANPQVKVILGYANDPTFADQAKCKEKALAQIADGSGIVFQVAGGCGLGALDAAKQRGVWGIGVDADQYYLGPHILTSAVKKVDVAVASTIAAYRANRARFKTNYNVVFDVKSGGVGLGRISPKVPAADRAKVEAIRRQLAAGKIKVPQK